MREDTVWPFEPPFVAWILRDAAWRCVLLVVPCGQHIARVFGASSAYCGVETRFEFRYAPGYACWPPCVDGSLPLLHLPLSP
jgi:hypothetical protein